MDEFKKWIKGHKALAIGGGIAIVVLLYLWLRSGSTASSAGSSSDSALSSYYSAEASSEQSAAEQAEYEDELQAASNQTNAESSVDTADINAQEAASVAPYQAELDADTLEANLLAYSDYLGEQGGSTSGGSAGGEYIPSSNPAATYILDEATGAITDINGNPISNPGGPDTASYGGGIVTLNPAGAVPITSSNENLYGGTLAPSLAAAAPAAASTTLQPGSFSGFSTPTV
jgi:hypothetical protein